MAPEILIQGLHFAYPSPLPDGSPVPAIRGVDLEVSLGQFLAVMGPVGAGKSTLCYALNGAIPHAIDGEFAGLVLLRGQDTRDVPMAQISGHVGLVFETTEAQLFNATVADEIAFGLEAMGLPPLEIEERIDQALDQVGLAGFRARIPRSLSGGEQKRLALACVLAMQPRILVLDEPTSGLDPRGRRKVIQAVDQLRVTQGGEVTVVMATQDAEMAAQFADRTIVLQQGRIALDGSPARVFAQVAQMDQWGLDVPQLARVAHLWYEQTEQTLDFSQPEALRRILGDLGPPQPPASLSSLCRKPPQQTEGLIQVQHLSHRYGGADDDALKGISLDILRGEWLAIIGVNGSGKSTLIKHFNGLLKPGRGEVRVAGKDTRGHQVGELARTVSYLPQNPDELIFSSSVHDEVAYGPRQLGLSGPALEERVESTLALLNLIDYADYPPAVLSYGLRRQVALASVLAIDAPVLVLDEPGVGLDRGALTRLMDVVSQRHKQGTTVVVVTHDLELVARYAQRVGILYQGRLIAQGQVDEVLTDVEKLARSGLEPLPVTKLAHSLHWPPPLPLNARDLLAYE